MNLFYLEILAVITAILCVGLATLNNKWNWIFGIISIMSYAYIFNEKGMYFQFSLQIFFIIQSIIGFFMWDDKDDIIKKMSKTDKFRFCGFIGFLFFMFFFFNYQLEYKLEFIVAVTSVVATFELIKRKSLAWLMWTVVNILSIIYFYISDMYLTMFLYVLFLINSIYAFYKWEKE